LQWFREITEYAHLLYVRYILTSFSGVPDLTVAVSDRRLAHTIHGLRIARTGGRTRTRRGSAG